MIEAMQSRELFTLEGSAAGIRGTHHRVRESGLRAELHPGEGAGAGVVFVNSLSPTRAANGDLAVYLADAFAECGYPSFRIDLPGFGDADGDPPPELHDFINRGAYASIGSAAITELVARFDLPGVIVIGHCAGALTALYTAGASKECCGLIMTSPYFYLPPVSMRPKLRRQLSALALQNKGFRYLRYIYDGLRAVRLKADLVLRSRPVRSLGRAFDRLKAISPFFRRTALPENANRNLLRCWKEVASGGLPILLLMEPGQNATGAKPKLGEFDYIQHILDIAGRRGRVVVDCADGADHSFANCLGRASVRRLTEQWLSSNFPRTAQRGSESGPASSEFSEDGEIAQSVTGR